MCIVCAFLAALSELVSIWRRTTPCLIYLVPFTLQQTSINLLLLFLEETTFSDLKDSVAENKQKIYHGTQRTKKQT